MAGIFLKVSKSIAAGAAIFLLTGCAVMQQAIHPPVSSPQIISSNEAIKDELRLTLLGNTAHDWEKTKEAVYNDIDNHNGFINCVYSDTQVKLSQKAKNGRVIFWPQLADGLEVEHTWPAKPDWGSGFERDSIPGNDLYNLYPARKGINASRSNLPFDMITKEREEFFVTKRGTLGSAANGIPSGSFKGKNDRNERAFEPRSNHKGNVARSMFYMSLRYQMPIPDSMETKLREWNRQDPVDDAEVKRAEKIRNVQHNRNTFIEEPALIDNVTDF